MRKIDPSNAVVLRGEALLSLNAGNAQAAIASLTDALKFDPNADVRRLKQVARLNSDA